MQTPTMPAQPVAATRPGPAVTGPTGRWWRQVAWRVVLVPLVVLLPLVTLAPTADHRFNIYWHGADFRTHPLRLITENLRTVPIYLQSGNFRPIGRILEDLVDLAAYLLMEGLDLPANIAFRLVSFVAAVVLTGLAVVFAESVLARGPLWRRAPSRLAALVPFGTGAGFVAAGENSTTVLFGGLYLLSTALVLAVVAALCRAVRPGRAGVARAVLAVLTGAFLAAFNEVAYLALPLAVVAVVVRARLVLRLGWGPALTGRAARLVALLWLGFLPVFVPVRMAIYSFCHSGGCYTGSDITVGPGAALAWPVRMLAWLPPLQWNAAGAGPSDVRGLLPLAVLLVLGVLGGRTAASLARYEPVSRRQAAGVAVVAGTLLALAAALAALNGRNQTDAAAGNWGLGWRDSGATMCGGTLVVLALFAGWARLRPLVAVLGVLALTGVVSAAANRRFLDDNAATPSSVLSNAIAHEMAVFDQTAAGNARRCALRATFADRYNDPAVGDDSADLPGARTALGRFDATVNLGAETLHGRPFCRLP